MEDAKTYTSKIEVSVAVEGENEYGQKAEEQYWFQYDGGNLDSVERMVTVDKSGNGLLSTTVQGRTKIPLSEVPDDVCGMISVDLSNAASEQ